MSNGNARISLIAAMAKNHVIGNGERIPWHISEDFQYFKTQTLDKPIIMGRLTFESIHTLKGTQPTLPALPKRHNIIVTRQEGYIVEGCTVCPSLNDAIIEAKNYMSEAKEIMICGGGQIYTQAMDHVDRMYLTILDDEHEGDVFFPQWSDDEWALTSSNPRDGFSFNIYDRQR